MLLAQVVCLDLSAAEADIRVLFESFIRRRGSDSLRSPSILVASLCLDPGSPGLSLRTQPHLG